MIQETIYMPVSSRGKVTAASIREVIEAAYTLGAKHGGCVADINAGGLSHNDGREEIRYTITIDLELTRGPEPDIL